MKRGDVIRILTEHKDDICNRYLLKKLGLFGSYARNDENENSDIDILIEFEGEPEGIFLLKEDKLFSIKNSFVSSRTYEVSKRNSKKKNFCNCESPGCR